MFFLVVFGWEVRGHLILRYPVNEENRNNLGLLQMKDFTFVSHAPLRIIRISDHDGMAP